MNILQVPPGYWPVIGGVERHVEALAERLVARGCQVTVATLEPRSGSLGNEAHRGAQIVRFPAWGLGDAYRIPVGLSAFLRENRNRFDIVHVHNYHAPLIPLVAAGGLHSFVLTTHLNDTPHSNVARLLHYAYRPVGAAAVRRASAVICVTEAERERVVRRLGVRQNRTAVIPNGFDPALVQAKDGARRDPFLLLSVGRLQAYKRVDVAIRGLVSLEPGYRLAIVGDGPERESLTGLTAELGLSERVTFVGRAADGDLVDWYRRAGVVVSLSSAEAFGMTVLEGVAAGAQVVASDIPAFVDLSRQLPEQVVTTPVESPAQVAQAVRRASGRTGNARADVTGFTWEAVTDRLVDVYRAVMEGTRERQAKGYEAGVMDRIRKREDERKISNAKTGAE